MYKRQKHILISYVGTDVAKQDKTITRTKEEAKKLADEIAAKVKANPMSLQEFLPESSDKGSAQQGGTPVSYTHLDVYKRQGKW